jgi:DNA polymerase-3 subunit beta
VAVVGDGLTITTEHAETTIKGLPADEFPVLPVVETKTEVTVPTTLFRSAIEGVLFAAANDESRPEISGLFLSLDQETVVLAATDSHRLSERRLTAVTGAATKTQVILPARACQEVLRILDDEQEATILRMDDKQAMVRSGETEVVTRLIEGQYPDYQQIIPTKHETTVKVAKEDLIDAVKAASLFSQPGINDVALSFQPDGTIKLTAASAQSGRHAATVTANISGPGKEVVFNYRYLLDGIQSLGSDEIVIELGEPQAPGVLRGAGSNSGLYLIMPILQ